MKLEEGMYVRIKNEAGWCCIGDIVNINDFREPSMKYCIDIQDSDLIFIPENMIVKANHNITDLIEVGDYVNGMPVYKYDNHLVINKLDGSYLYLEELRVINSIVTKEQFESISYKVD